MRPRGGTRRLELEDIGHVETSAKDPDGALLTVDELVEEYDRTIAKYTLFRKDHLAMYHQNEKWKEDMEAATREANEVKQNNTQLVRENGQLKGSQESIKSFLETQGIDAVSLEQILTEEELQARGQEGLANLRSIQDWLNESQPEIDKLCQDLGIDMECDDDITESSQDKASPSRTHFASITLQCPGHS